MTKNTLSENDLEILSSIGSRLKAVRIQNGYTLRRMAELFGVSQRTYQTYEDGQRQMSILALNRGCRKLGISTDYIVFGKTTTFEQSSIFETDKKELSEVKIRQHISPVGRIDVLEECDIYSNLETKSGNWEIKDHDELLFSIEHNKNITVDILILACRFFSLGYGFSQFGICAELREKFIPTKIALDFIDELAPTKEELKAYEKNKVTDILQS